MHPSFQLSAQLGVPLYPYVIAEIGVNHEGDLERAKRLIERAKLGGADAAKFQTYKADLIASKSSPAYWDTAKEPTTSQYALFRRYDAFGPEEYTRLAEHCRAVGIDFLSTPFDLGAVEYLDGLMALYKIASADITNVPLLRAVAGKGKPVILSTGAATLPEIEFALETLKAAGARAIGLLHCVLNYPTPMEAAQLNTIAILARAFPEVSIGYSDHTIPTPGMEVLTTAVLLGATVVEKHFTDDTSLPGNDHYHAMDTEGLKSFLRALDFQRSILGAPEKSIDNESQARLHARRSLVVSRDLPKGHVITARDLIAKRPGHGISPVFWDSVIGKTLRRSVSADALLAWADLAD